MSGIYIHIPFCKKACHYCNFHFSTSKGLMPAMQKAILSELAMRKDYIEGEPLRTIYWGGGTPSLIPIEDLEAQMNSIFRHFNVLPDAEITLEANPDDLSEEKLNAWKLLGVNRLSIGVQSFFEEDLQWMNRAHNSTQSQKGLEKAMQYFDNISIDFIYGTPGLTDERWKKNIDTALEMGIPHLSCYALTVEPKTALEQLIAKKKKEEVNVDSQARQYLLLLEWLDEAGYEAYEISNFALPGKRSRHNSSYWKGHSYLGIGPSAHSYNGKSRQWNIANNALYIKSIENGNLSFEREELGRTQQINEHLMIRLRMMEGLDIYEYTTLFGSEESERVFRGMDPFIDNGWIVWDGQTAKLSRDGRLMADGIASELFAEESK